MSTDLTIPGRISATALALPDDLAFEDWERTGEQLRLITEACQWWVGDWLNYGERNYGEKYAQALDHTDYDYGTLATFAWVAKHVEVSTRIETLSWSHHRQVAPLGPADQDRWLTAAEANEWSVGQLRKQIKGASQEDAECCPTCGRKLPAGKAT